MFETFIVIEDVGVEPDYTCGWPKRGIARITHNIKDGLPSLGTLTVHLRKDGGYSRKTISVDFWDDGNDLNSQNAWGAVGHLDVTELCDEKHPLQLACNEIPKSLFETYIVFDSIREVEFIPKKH